MRSRTMSPTPRRTKSGDTALTPTVFVVDDDDGMRESLEFLFRTIGLPVQAFASAPAFLEAYEPSMRGCLLLDVRMPGMSGLDLQEHLRRQKIRIPVVMLTAYATVPMAVRAMHAGAFDFLEKPFEDDELLDRVQRAMAYEADQRADDAWRDRVRARLDRLTPREREVMDCVVEGLLNKQIADRLSISPKTVESHRAAVMSKMEAGTVAELVRMALAVTFKR